MYDIFLTTKDRKVILNYQSNTLPVKDDIIALPTNYSFTVTHRIINTENNKIVLGGNVI